MKWLFLFFRFALPTILSAQIEFSHRTEAFYTHQPVLYEMATRTSGPIVEFGCGYGSTDMLHEICKKDKRLLISLDDNWQWLSIFQEKYKDDAAWHQFIFVPKNPLHNSDSPEHWIDFLNDSGFEKMSFDLCFIDQQPWLGRFETIKYMKDKAKFIIVHDCDYFPTHNVFGKTLVPTVHFIAPGVFDFSDIFRYFKVYFPLYPWPGGTGPPTLLGSDFENDLPEIDFHDY